MAFSLILVVGKYIRRQEWVLLWSRKVAREMVTDA